MEPLEVPPASPRKAKKGFTDLYTELESVRDHLDYFNWKTDDLSSKIRELDAKLNDLTVKVSEWIENVNDLRKKMNDTLAKK